MGDNNDQNNKTQQPTHVNNVLEYEGSSHKHLPSKSNSSNEEKENTNDDIEKKKNVRFAPMNKIRQFSNLDTVSTLLQADERAVELQNNAGKGPMRRPKRTKIPTTGISLMKSEPDASFAISSSFDSIYGDKHTSQQTAVRGRKKNGGDCTQIQIALLHSHSHTQILYHAMQYIHQDRDILLESLLKCCGILHGAKNALSSFLTIVPPKMGTRKLLETFHHSEYLDLLEYPPLSQSLANVHDDGTANCNGSDVDGVDTDMSESIETINDTHIKSFETSFSPPPSPEESISSSYMYTPSDEVLAKYGLEDDCPYPNSSDAHAALWKYCLAVAGTSWYAASLLTAIESNDNNQRTDVAIHFGGGRHHSHANKAGGFCFISDVILAIKRLLYGNNAQVDDGMFVVDPPIAQRNLVFRRVLYLDIDVHHGDAVQAEFYNTDQVLTTSFHRYSAGFYPTTGAISEKGDPGTKGLGYSLNIPLPARTVDVDFIQIYRKALFGLCKAYDPHAIVLLVGTDGLEGDELVSGSFENAVSGEGWNLSPEGISECVRITAVLCAGQSEDEICVAPVNKQQAGKTHNVDNTPELVGDSDTKEEEESKTVGKRRKLLILGGGGYVSSSIAHFNVIILSLFSCSIYHLPDSCPDSKDAIVINCGSL